MNQVSPHFSCHVSKDLRHRPQFMPFQLYNRLPYLYLNDFDIFFQNSVLGLVLATKHFGNPLTAVPCAVSSICHSVYGSILAGIWRSMPTKDKGEWCDDHVNRLNSLFSWCMKDYTRGSKPLIEWRVVTLSVVALCVWSIAAKSKHVRVVWAIKH